MKKMYGNIVKTDAGMYWASTTSNKAGRGGVGFQTDDYVRKSNAMWAANRMAEKLDYFIEWEGEEG